MSGQVWQKLGWSLQYPARRARERDEAAIEEWTTKHWVPVKQP
jgi:transposase